MRIGIIADTHVPYVVKQLPQQLAKAFAGVELILHAGDVYLPSVLDELEDIAPILAAYGNGEELWRVKPDADPRMKRRQVVAVDDLHIGLTHILGAPEAPIEKSFDHPVDIAICGHTHLPSIEEYKGIYIINPGSACMHDHQVNELGTVGILDIGNNKVEIRILQLDHYNGSATVVQKVSFQK